MSTSIRTFVADTPDDRLKPGAVWIWSHAGRCSEWDNCDGEHINVRLPNGEAFSLSVRASNCGLPDDRTHRCWVLDGPLDELTASKRGETCPAGAGSILYGSWHGFLRDGLLTEA